jgi:hypothetical protein
MPGTTDVPHNHATLLDDDAIVETAESTLRHAPNRLSRRFGGRRQVKTGVVSELCQMAWESGSNRLIYRDTSIAGQGLPSRAEAAGGRILRAWLFSAPPLTLRID